MRDSWKTSEEFSAEIYCLYLVFKLVQFQGCKKIARSKKLLFNIHFRSKYHQRDLFSKSLKFLDLWFVSRKSQGGCQTCTSAHSRVDTYECISRRTKCSSEHSSSSLREVQQRKAFREQSSREIKNNATYRVSSIDSRLIFFIFWSYLAWSFVTSTRRVSCVTSRWSRHAESVGKSCS